ncbi:unnamed protein product [Diamesa hyperborea]
MAFFGLLLAYVIIILLIIEFYKLICSRKCCVKVFIEEKKQLKHKLDNQIVLNDKKGDYQILPQPPGPFPWPILGNLVLLGKYAVPFDGFSQLAKVYGNLYSLTLGSTRCIIVNNLDLIKEVLNQNGKFFGGRPNFLRYHKIFGGDRNNSLALCDWSNLQQKRRNLARKHCSPRDNSSFHQKLNDVGCCEMQECMKRLQSLVKPDAEIYLKPIIMETCANMFTQYMCSVRFDYEDVEFKQMVRCFDEIFWEINQGYAVDFLPFLAPFYTMHMKNIESWAKTIRNVILERIIMAREQTIKPENEPEDFTDALLRSLNLGEDISKDTIIFMLEDFIGGHSAIGNCVYLALGYIAKDPSIGRRIQEEVDKVTQNGQTKVTLFDTDKMPFTIATIYEVLRYSSSPIVPHVATENTSIGGYGIMKDTIVFINNYDLNTSEEYWDNPKDFNPDRFLEYVSCEKLKKEQHQRTATSKNMADGDGILRVKKNIPHFLPFSVGKRTCIGQNLVRCFSFLILTNILQQYDISSKNIDKVKMYPACVALEPDTYSLTMTPR